MFAVFLPVASDKPDSVCAAIYLSSLPVEVSLFRLSGGQPSNLHLFGIAPEGGCQLPPSPTVLVGSYPTLSPLPVRISPSVFPPTYSLSGQAVSFLWPFPQGYPCLPFGSFLPCGVRTFLPFMGRLLQRPLAENIIMLL